jgi:hypothetical protein
LTGTAGYPVDPGGSVRIALTVTFPASAGNASQEQRMDFVLRVTLTQLTGPVPPIPPAFDRGLPNTGASSRSGVLLAVAPASAVHRRRRPRRAPPTPSRPRRTMKPTRLRDRVRALLAVGTVLRPRGRRDAGRLDRLLDRDHRHFSTGTIDIRLGSGANDPNPFAFTSFALANMGPGSTTTAHAAGQQQRQPAVHLRRVRLGHQLRRRQRPARQRAHPADLRRARAARAQR